MRKAYPGGPHHDDTIILYATTVVGCRLVREDSVALAMEYRQ